MQANARLPQTILILTFVGFSWLALSYVFMWPPDGRPFRTIPMPTGTVDIASVPEGYQNHYCPAEFTVEDVFSFHKRQTK